MVDFKQWLQLKESLGSGNISKEGNIFVGTYQTIGGKKFDLEFSISNGVAQVSYLRARKFAGGTGTFKELLPLISKQMKELGIVKIQFNAALDDKTNGQSRNKLFNKYIKSL